MNYYNEWDPHAAAWLRELIKQGLIPNGDVDERSITDVSPADLAGYTQCHFFAGIGGWSYALELAGWDPKKPVGTASCPCQPFSTAGEGKGQEDERHLYPVFHKLLVECRALGQPWTHTVFGEQVASAIGFGWLDGVSSDLEAEGYVVGAAVLGAHSVGAPHIRQRLYWVAVANSEGLEERREHQGVDQLTPAVGGGSIERLEHAESDGREQWRPESDGRSIERGCGASGMGDADSAGSLSRRQAAEASGHGSSVVANGGLNAWSDFELIPCADGKARRIESGTFPLAHGVPGRVGLLRGYGNAIVPQVAAEFIKAFVESVK